MIFQIKMKKKIWLVILFSLLLSFNPCLQRNQDYYLDQNKKNNNSISPILSIRVKSYTVPGVSRSVSFDRILRIGLLADMNDESGDLAWKEALLAAREINEDGGILINGTQYYIGLVSENTDEFNPNLDISKGIDAAENIISGYDPHFIIGGFQIACSDQYIETVMNYRVPFICIGNMANHLIELVKSDYSRYKYLFRVWPLNGTAHVYLTVEYLIHLTKYLYETYGGVDKVAIIRRDTDYHNQWANLFFYPILPLFGLTIVYERVFSSSSTEDDFKNVWEEVEASDAQITLLVSNYDSGDKLMLQSYGEIKPQCLLINLGYGIPWDETGGSCQYMISLAPYYNISITPRTILFLNKFFKEYGTEPVAWGVFSAGAYNAIKMLANATMDAQSFDSETIVKSLEKINRSNPFPTPFGKHAFTQYHDVLKGWPYAVPFWLQSKYIDGSTELLSTGGITYPDSIVTGGLRIPPWGINNLVADYSQNLPGSFILDIDSDAGAFNLSWTGSKGADNYSVYMSNKKITYINKELDLLAYQTSTSSLSISGLKEGDYYFTVVAYNKTGETMSSNVVHITVPGRFPYEIVIVVVIVIIVGVIPAGMIILKRKSSRREKISEKDRRIKIEKKDIKEQEQKSPKSVDLSIAALSSRKLEEIEETEAEIGIEKEQHICLIHGGKIVGAMYLCPSCESYYCIECATDMKNKGETCRACNHEIELQ